MKTTGRVSATLYPAVAAGSVEPERWSGGRGLRGFEIALTDAGTGVMRDHIYIGLH